MSQNVINISKSANFYGVFYFSLYILYILSKFTLLEGAIL